MDSRECSVSLLTRPGPSIDVLVPGFVPASSALMVQLLGVYVFAKQQVREQKLVRGAHGGVCVCPCESTLSLLQIIVVGSLVNTGDYRNMLDNEKCFLTAIQKVGRQY